MNKITRSAFQASLLALTLAVLFAAPARATLMVYEPFNYSPAGADVVGNSGGGSFGFAGPWTGNNTFDLAADNLHSQPFLPRSGNHVTAAAFNANRDIDRVLAQPIGADNTTTYFSFLMQPEGVIGDGFFHGFFGFSLRAGLRNLHVGRDANHTVYGLDDIMGNLALSNVQMSVGVPKLLVLRADFLPGNDVYRLYVDPPTGQPEPATANATLTLFDLQIATSLGLTGPGAYAFDELRIGTTWNDVTPVPEPSALVLATCGGFSVLALAFRLRHLRQTGPCSLA